MLTTKMASSFSQLESVATGVSQTEVEPTCLLCRTIESGDLYEVRKQIQAERDVCECKTKQPVYRIIKQYQKFLRQVRTDNMSKSEVCKSTGVVSSETRRLVLETIAKLLAGGADLNYTTGVETPLMAAVSTCDEGLLWLLLDFKADVNVHDGMEDMNALGLAILLNEVSLVEILLKQGGKVNAPCCGSLVPIQLAMNKNSAVSNMLIQYGADVHVLRTILLDAKLFSQSPLKVAIFRKNVHLARLLLEHGEDVNQTLPDSLESPIHQAVRSLDLDMIQLLIEFGADLNRPNFERHTPLGLALLNEDPVSTEIAKKLILAGASPNLRTRISFFQNTYTPLHIACFKGNFEFVRFLVEEVCSRIGYLDEEMEAPVSESAKIGKKDGNLAPDSKAPNFQERYFKWQPHSDRCWGSTPSASTGVGTSREASASRDGPGSVAASTGPGAAGASFTHLCHEDRKDYRVRSEMFSPSNSPAENGTNKDAKEELNPGSLQKEGESPRTENVTAGTEDWSPKSETVTEERESWSPGTEAVAAETKGWLPQTDAVTGESERWSTAIGTVAAGTESWSPEVKAVTARSESWSPRTETAAVEAAMSPSAQGAVPASDEAAVVSYNMAVCQSHSCASRHHLRLDHGARASRFTKFKMSSSQPVETDADFRSDGVFTVGDEILHKAVRRHSAHVFSRDEDRLARVETSKKSYRRHSTSASASTVGRDQSIGSSGSDKSTTDVETASKCHSTVPRTEDERFSPSDGRRTPAVGFDGSGLRLEVGATQRDTVNGSPEVSEVVSDDVFAPAVAVAELVAPEEPIFQIEFGSPGYVFPVSMENSWQNMFHTREQDGGNTERRSHCVKRFLNQAGIDGSTALFMAVYDGNVELVDYLIQNGADPYFKSHHGNFHHAAVLSQSVSLIQRALSLGCPIDEPNMFGNSPLTLVSRLDLPEACELLITNGADMNSRDRYGESPLLTSIYFGCEMNARMLIQHGADMNAMDDNHTSAIYWSIFNNRQRTLKLLLMAGAHFTPQVFRQYPRNIRVMHNRPLFRFIQHYVHQPRTLQDLTTLRIRSHLAGVCRGCSILCHVDRLPLPTRLKDMLYLKHFIEAIEVVKETDEVR